jgi:hypothetical protein
VAIQINSLLFIFATATFGLPRRRFAASRNDIYAFLKNKLFYH